MKTDFRLFKRRDDGTEMPATETGHRERPYYFRFTHKGKSYLRCLETNDATDAQKYAKAKYKEITEAVTRDDFKRLEATKLRQDASVPIAKIIEAYRIGPTEAGAASRTANINSFLAILQASGLTDESALRELTPVVARKWFELATASALKVSDQQQAASIKRSANSRWQQAASLFTPRCLAHYLDLGHIQNFTSLNAFSAAGKAARFDKKKLKIIYRPPSETIIQKTLEAWEALADAGNTTAKDVFLVIGHELAFGLRAGEMRQACWSWHQIRNGYPVLDGEATAKNGSGLVQVRALDPFYSTMVRIAKAKGWWPEDISQAGSALIITGTETYRNEDVYRAVSAFLRDLGWETQKTNHALRAYAGSQIASRYGIWDASSWLRHSSVEVTQDHYTYFLKTFPVADKEQIPTKWATLPTATAAGIIKPAPAKLEVPPERINLLAHN